MEGGIRKRKPFADNENGTFKQRVLSFTTYDMENCVHCVKAQPIHEIIGEHLQ